MTVSPAAPIQCAMKGLYSVEKVLLVSGLGAKKKTKIDDIKLRGAANNPVCTAK